MVFTHLRGAARRRLIKSNRLGPLQPPVVAPQPATVLAAPLSEGGGHTLAAFTARPWYDGLRFRRGGRRPSAWAAFLLSSTSVLIP